MMACHFTKFVLFLLAIFVASVGIEPRTIRIAELYDNHETTVTAEALSQH